MGNACGGTPCQRNHSTENEVCASPVREHSSYICLSICLCSTWKKWRQSSTGREPGRTQSEPLFPVLAQQNPVGANTLSSSESHALEGIIIAFDVASPGVRKPRKRQEIRDGRKHSREVRKLD